MPAEHAAVVHLRQARVEPVARRQELQQRGAVCRGRKEVGDRRTARRAGACRRSASFDDSTVRRRAPPGTRRARSRAGPPPCARSMKRIPSVVRPTFDVDRHGRGRRRAQSSARVTHAGVPEIVAHQPLDARLRRAARIAETSAARSWSVCVSTLWLRRRFEVQRAIESAGRNPRRPRSRSGRLRSLAATVTDRSEWRACGRP